MTQILQYGSEIGENESKEVQDFCKDTVLGIKHHYKKGDSFIKGTLKGINLKKKSSIVLVIKDSTRNKILACLVGSKNYNEEMQNGRGNILYTKYISTNKENKRSGLATKLQKEFENLAKKVFKETGQFTSVVAAIEYGNTDSIKFFKSLGYKLYDDKERGYYQAYKDYELKK